MKLGDAMALAMNKQPGRGCIPDAVKDSGNYIFKKERKCNIRTKRERIESWCDTLEKGQTFTMGDVGNIFNITPRKAGGMCRCIPSITLIKKSTGRGNGLWVKL
jgi:hypothetical protein